MSTALQVRPGSEMARTEKSLTNFASDSMRQYLSFILNNEEYGIDILHVQELRSWEEPTLLPNAPLHIKGVVNLRGLIVPVIDLRAMLGMPTIAYGPTTVVIILSLPLQGRQRVIGVVVDTVSEVFDADMASIKAAPDFGNKIDAAFIQGLYRVNEKVVILLRTERLLDLEKLI